MEPRSGTVHIIQDLVEAIKTGEAGRSNLRVVRISQKIGFGLYESHLRGSAAISPPVPTGTAAFPAGRHLQFLYTLEVDILLTHHQGHFVVARRGSYRFYKCIGHYPTFKRNKVDQLLQSAASHCFYGNQPVVASSSILLARSG
jgi:hypothetical protein